MSKQELRVVWEDLDHAYAWASAFEKLREIGVTLEVINGYTERGIIREREYQLSAINANVFVIHSGSVSPPDLSTSLQDIRRKHEAIRILLQTEAVNPLTLPHIDGVVSIYMMTEIDELVKVLTGGHTYLMR